MIELRNLGTGTFDVGNAQCQALGGHLPVVTTNIVSTFLANKFGGQIWLSLRTSRLEKINKLVSQWNATVMIFISFYINSFLKLRSFTNSPLNAAIMNVTWVYIFNSMTNVCTGQACVTSNKWYWIGNNGKTSQLMATDLAAVKDMISSSDAKTCISMAPVAMAVLQLWFKKAWLFYIKWKVIDLLKND